MLEILKSKKVIGIIGAIICAVVTAYFANNGKDVELVERCKAAVLADAANIPEECTELLSKEKDEKVEVTEEVKAEEKAVVVEEPKEVVETK